MFLPTVTLCNASFFTRFVQLVSSVLLQLHTSYYPGISGILSEVSNLQQHKDFTSFILNFKLNMFVTGATVMMNAALAMEILDLI
jgi:hypothetical protein